MNETNVMSYKGYSARVEYDAENEILFGRLAGIRDIISFEGRTSTELKKNFREAVNDYIETCAKLGDDPQKPFSGNIALRVSPDLHAKIATKAELSGKSMNQWAAEVLEKSAA